MGNENRLFLEYFVGNITFDGITVDSYDYNDVMMLRYSGWHTDYFNLGLF